MTTLFQFIPAVATDSGSISPDASNLDDKTSSLEKVRTISAMIGENVKAIDLIMPRWTRGCGGSKDSGA